MPLTTWMDKTLPRIVDELVRHVECNRTVQSECGLNLLRREAVHKVADDFMTILFPGCHGHEPISESHMEVFFNVQLRAIAAVLMEQMEFAFRYQCEFEKCKTQECDTCHEKSEAAVMHLIESLPAVRAILQEDIQAAFEGDPAARSPMEIVLSYPCITAIAVHRLAHLLYEKGAPLIPRIMSELAHSRTGIDIHPGARIGGGFFIDHGTGVVIGETSIIGRNVKLYQGVTLGALSFPKDEHGNPIKGVKRHPEVRDNVTIYAGAIILGGETVVGEGSTIGANVWLNHSVPPNSKVHNRQPGPNIKTPDKDG